MFREKTVIFASRDSFCFEVLALKVWFLHGKPDILESNASHSQPQGSGSCQFGTKIPIFAA